MDFSVQYITNQSGEKQAVIVPIEDWLSLQKQTLLYDDISESMREAVQMEKGSKPTQTLMEFLDDC